MSRENHIYEPDWSGRTDQLCSVNKPVIKKDALTLVTGKPVYVDDLAPKDCLIVKVLRSPHANAIVKSPAASPLRRLRRVGDGGSPRAAVVFPPKRCIFRLSY